MGNINTIFDTLKYSRKLEKAGLNYKIAETQACIQKEIIEKIYNNFSESQTLPEIYTIFDTLNYAKRLIAVEHEPAIAEVEAELQKDIITILYSKYHDACRQKYINAQKH